jgi:hypothetical protein
MEKTCIDFFCPRMLSLIGIVSLLLTTKVVVMVEARGTTTDDFDVIQLTNDNYDEMTEGKTVFIKFFAPWASI